MIELSLPSATILSRYSLASKSWLAVTWPVCYTLGVSDCIVQPQWTTLAEEALCGTMMILGASDTGKSTLAQYLFQELCRRGFRAGYLDADVGQSALGPPTTMSLALAGDRGDAQFPPRGPSASYFVGATTPRGHMLPALVAAYRLQQKAEQLGAEVVIVDTTGLVDRSQGGQTLKQWKIELLAPTTVVALQRGHELESILWPLRRGGLIRCVELAVSPHVKTRSRETRIARRRARLSCYFAQANTFCLSPRRLAAFGLERLAAGALLGFQDEEGYCLGLGAVEQIRSQDGTCIVHTPLGDLDGVSSLRFGTTRWDLRTEREM